MNIYTLDEEIVHELIVNHIQDYTKFMEEVLALEMLMCMDRKQAVLQVAKRYPQFNIN